MYKTFKKNNETNLNANNIFYCEFYITVYNVRF